MSNEAWVALIYAAMLRKDFYNAGLLMALWQDQRSRPLITEANKA